MTILSAACAVFLVSVAGPVWAAGVTANSSAQVYTPISITENQALDFGTFASPTLSGTVLRGLFSRSVTGGIELISADDGAAASFIVTGEPSISVTIIYPSSATVTSGGDSMTVDSFVPVSTCCTTSLGGVLNFDVGATLLVDADQPVGSYSGTYELTASYD